MNKTFLAAVIVAGATYTSLGHAAIVDHADVGGLRTF